MPEIVFAAHDGPCHPVVVESGATLMLAAVDHGVPGIDGDCGGQRACATCLACRITVTEALDGLTVSRPDGQH